MRKQKIIPYKPYLKEKARELRNNSTFTEIQLWQYLKGKQMCGYDFHRQKPIDNYIVDFYCGQLMLAIEVDGESHYGNEEKDKKRQHKMEKLGVSFLRFDDLEIQYNLENVLLEIEKWIKSNAKIKEQISKQPTKEKNHDTQNIIDR